MCEKNIKKYTIGEVSGILDISQKTLRNYDKMGLVVPYYIAPETGYRYFSYDQFFRIDVIRYLNKTMNIPLKDVKALLEEHKDYDKIITLLEGHQKELDKKIALLKYARQLTEDIKSDIRSRAGNIHGHRIYEQFLMSRHLRYIEVNAPITEIDIYAKRALGSLDQSETGEHNIMVLLVDLNRFHESQQVFIKGFGIFSEDRLPDLKTKYIHEGRYIINHFKFSETAMGGAIEEALKYAQSHQIQTAKYALLVSRMVDLAAGNKYEYYMDLQILEK